MKKVLLPKVLRTTAVLFFLILTVSVSFGQDKVEEPKNTEIVAYSEDELGDFLNELYQSYPENKFVTTAYKNERILESASDTEFTEEYLNTLRADVTKARIALRSIRYLMDEGADFHKAFQSAKSQFKENTLNLSDISQ